MRVHLNRYRKKLKWILQGTILHPNPNYDEGVKQQNSEGVATKLRQILKMTYETRCGKENAVLTLGLNQQ